MPLKGKSTRKVRNNRPLSARHLRAVMSPHKIRVPPHPPSIVTKPWFNLTVRHVPSGVTVTTNGIGEAIRVQLFGTNSPILIGDLGLVIKINSVRVWGALPSSGTATTMAPLVVMFFDFIQQANISTSSLRYLDEITEYPDLVSRPAIGYRYGAEHRDFVLTTHASTATSILNIPSGVNATTTVIYWDLCIRFANPVTFAADTGLSEDFVSLTL